MSELQKGDYVLVSKCLITKCGIIPTPFQEHELQPLSALEHLAMEADDYRE